MAPLLKIVNVNTAGIELQLKRIADLLEAYLVEKPELTPQDFDPDEFSAATYSDLELERAQERLADRMIGGVLLE